MHKTSLCLLAFALLIVSTACGTGDGDGGVDAWQGGDVTPQPGEPASVAGITDAHNQVRAMVSVEPLAWDAEVAAFADEWAAELERQGCVMAHRPGSGEFAQRYGENVFWSMGYAPTAANVVEAWASEVKAYDYASNGCSGTCGHYTQIVWRDSVRLGCAMRSCVDPNNNMETQVWVCNYDPPGNYVGEKPY